MWTKNNTEILNAAKINGIAGIYNIAADGSGILGRIPIIRGNEPDWVGGIVPVNSPNSKSHHSAAARVSAEITRSLTLSVKPSPDKLRPAAHIIFRAVSGQQILFPKHRLISTATAKPTSAFFVRRPANGGFNYSATSQTFAVQFGQTDKLVPADFTGDGKTDIAFWRPSTDNGLSYEVKTSSFYAFPFGFSGDIPAPADYDGDGKADAAVFRPSSATWFILRSSDGGVTIQQFGVDGRQTGGCRLRRRRQRRHRYFPPVGFRVVDQKRSGGLLALQFGSTGDKTVPGDYTGDGKTDVAFFRPSTGQWFVLRSEDLSYYAFPFGSSGDIAAPGDYDGDGKSDAAVFRPSNSTWFIQRSTGGTIIQGFGQSGDIAVPTAFIP